MEKYTDPPPIHPSQQQQSKWSSLLWECGDDFHTCCITFWLPCVTYGRIAEVLDQGQSSCVAQGCIYALLMPFAFHWLVSCIYRDELRAKFDLPAEPCSDCCVHCFCEPCSLCQEYAELRNRGIDPSKGWIDESPNTPPPTQLPPSML